MGKGKGKGQVCHGLKGSISDSQGRSQVVHWGGGAVGSGGLGYGEEEGSGQVCHGLKGSISDNQGRSQFRSGLERWLIVREEGGQVVQGHGSKFMVPAPQIPSNNGLPDPSDSVDRWTEKVKTLPSLVLCMWSVKMCLIDDTVILRT